MKQMELEIKVLDIDKIKFIEKLESLGAQKLEIINEKMYVYDLFGNNARYYDILNHINFYSNDKNRKLKKEWNESSKIKYITAVERLRLLFNDLDLLIDNKEKQELKEKFNCEWFEDILEMDNLNDFLNNKAFKTFIEKFFLNKNKWLRLRQVNGKAEITVKHILPDNGKIQQIEETEIIVPNIEEGNEFLEAIGFKYKNYFEKERIKYSLDGYEIDIDSWPKIPTYFEIEGKDEEDLEFILNKLGYTLDDTVSFTAKEVFIHYGKSMFDNREMKFDN